MGIGPRITTSCLARPAEPYRAQTPNPNPRRWTAVRSEVVNEHLILLAHYPDCTNYEGVKLLLFSYGVKLNDLLRQGALDPHFCDPRMSGYKHPIARFEPTDRGWAMAVAVAQSGAGI